MILKLFGFELEIAKSNKPLFDAFEMALMADEAAKREVPTFVTDLQKPNPVLEHKYPTLEDWAKASDDIPSNWFKRYMSEENRGIREMRQRRLETELGLPDWDKKGLRPSFVPSVVAGDMSSEWNDIEKYLDKVDVKFTKPEKPLWQKWNPLI